MAAGAPAMPGAATAWIRAAADNRAAILRMARGIERAWVNLYAEYNDSRGMAVVREPPPAASGNP